MKIGETAYTNIKYDRAALVDRYQSKRDYFLDRRDSASFSALGMQLNLLINGENQRAANQVQFARWQRLSAGVRDETLRKMDDRISAVGKLMDRMVALAEAATDEDLDDYDRINMQIEICRLQFEIDGMVGNDAYAGPDHFLGFDQKTGAILSMGSVAEKFEDTQVYQMLDRARGRVMNGGKWDVAEVRNAIVKFDESGRKEFLRYQWDAVNDETVPTIGDLLKGQGRSVMDAEAAAVTSAELEEEIETLRENREKLASLVAREQSGDLDPEKQDDQREIDGFANELTVFFHSLHREPYLYTEGRHYTEEREDVTGVAMRFAFTGEGVEAAPLDLDEEARLTIVEEDLAFTDSVPIAKPVLPESDGAEAASPSAEGMLGEGVRAAFIGMTPNGKLLYDTLLSPVDTGLEEEAPNEAVRETPGRGLVGWRAAYE